MSADNAKRNECVWARVHAYMHLWVCTCDWGAYHDACILHVLCACAHNRVFACLHSYANPPVIVLQSACVCVCIIVRVSMYALLGLCALLCVALCISISVCKGV